MLSFFPRGVLDEILNLIESVSEEFPSYSSQNESRFSLSNIDFQTIFCLGSGCKKLPEISNLQNPFWVDILTCWADFCNILL